MNGNRPDPDVFTIAFWFVVVSLVLLVAYWMGWI